MRKKLREMSFRSKKKGNVTFCVVLILPRETPWGEKTLNNVSVPWAISRRDLWSFIRFERVAVAKITSGKFRSATATMCSSDRNKQRTARSESQVMKGVR